MYNKYVADATQNYVLQHMNAVPGIENIGNRTGKDLLVVLYM